MLFYNVFECLSLHIYIHLCIYIHTHTHAYICECTCLYLKIKFHKTIYTFVLCKKLVFFSTCSPSFLIKGCLTTTKIDFKTQNGLPLEKHWFEKSWVPDGPAFEKLEWSADGQDARLASGHSFHFLLGDEKRERSPTEAETVALLTSHSVLVMTDDSKPLNSDREEIFVAFCLNFLWFPGPVSAQVNWFLLVFSAGRAKASSNSVLIMRPLSYLLVLASQSSNSC